MIKSPNMKNVVYILVWCLILCMVSCIDKHDERSSEIIFVDVDVEQQSPLTDFISEGRHICLETNDSCILAAGGFIGFVGDTIVMEYKSEIYTFSPSGKYICSFNHHGQGPGEYTGIYGMRVYDRCVYILDRDIKKIFKYTLDGQLINEINLEHNFLSFDVQTKDRIILASGYSSHSMSQFVIIDSNSGEILTKICPYDICRTISYWDYLPFSGRKNEDIYVNIPFSQCTYRLDKYYIDSIASYSFNTKVQLPKVGLKSLDIDAIGANTRNTNVIRNLGHYYPAENCYYQTYWLFGDYGYQNYLLKFDKQGKQMAQRMISKTDDSYPYFNDIYGFNNGEIICIRNADVLLHKDELMNNNYWQEQGLTEESNPVIFFYKLKET